MMPLPLSTIRFGLEGHLKVTMNLISGQGGEPSHILLPALYSNRKSYVMTNLTLNFGFG